MKFTCLFVCFFYFIHVLLRSFLMNQICRRKGYVFLKNYLSFLFKTTNAIISVVINPFKGGFINLQYTFSVPPH